MREDFCAFILTHGRPDKIYTYRQLRKQGYTGKIYFVIDDEDKTRQQYIEQFGSNVLIFSKSDIASRFDETDNFGDRRSIFCARNACFELAKKVGCKYFIQLDGDYTAFQFRIGKDLEAGYTLIQDLDAILGEMLAYASTLQLIMGGRVIGTFPLYKGNKILLEAGDLIAGIAVCCILDKSKSFFNVINPTAIYNSPVNQIYPVGIVVWFAQHKNPNTLFPGTSWNYIGENRTIRLGKADGSDIMTTGGADSVTLNGNHLPSNQHSFYAQTSGYDYGNKETWGFDYGTKNTTGAGGHNHFLPGAIITQDQNTGAVAGGRAGSWARDKATNWVGDHHHSVHIGAHSHTVGIGAHAHSVSGTTSFSGHNSAFSVTNPFVKLMAWYRNA